MPSLPLLVAHPAGGPVQVREDTPRVSQEPVPAAAVLHGTAESQCVVGMVCSLRIKPPVPVLPAWYATFHTRSRTLACHTCFIVVYHHSIARLLTLTYTHIFMQCRRYCRFVLFPKSVHHVEVPQTVAQCGRCDSAGELRPPMGPSFEFTIKYTNY